MKRHLATKNSIAAYQGKQTEKASLKSTAPENIGVSKEKIAKSIKGLKKSGYKISEKLKPKVLP